MDTTGNGSWVIHKVTDDAVTLERRIDGEADGGRVIWDRWLLPEDVDPGGELHLPEEVVRTLARLGPGTQGTLSCDHGFRGARRSLKSGLLAI